MIFNHSTFFNSFRLQWGALKQPQVDGLTFLLNSFESDARWGDVRWIAYGLGTIKRECGDRWQPIEEYGGKLYLSKYFVKPSLRKALGNIKLSDSYNYKGRGFVQITGRANYTKFARLLNEPLVEKPERALDPSVAFEIMTRGMFSGAFTGKKLTDYVNDLATDFFNARRVINALDHAGEIAVEAGRFLKILKNCRVYREG